MKGMRKISRGKGFGGVMAYIFDRESGKDPGRLIGGNMSGTEPGALAQEFGHVRGLRPDIAKPVWHNSLRMPAGEVLTDHQLVTVADDYMKRMGFTDTHQYCIVAHDDAEGQHVHIVANRISLESKIYVGENENLISTRVISDLEKQHGLQITRGVDYDEHGKIVMPERKQLKKAEIDMAVGTGEMPPRMQLQRAIDAIVEDKPTTQVFVERLELAGIAAVPNVASTGRMNGFSFEKDGISFKASQLGDSYKWQQLEQRIDYDKNRDLSLIHI